MSRVLLKVAILKLQSATILYSLLEKPAPFMQMPKALSIWHLRKQHSVPFNQMVKIIELIIPRSMLG